MCDVMLWFICTFLSYHLCIPRFQPNMGYCNDTHKKKYCRCTYNMVAHLLSCTICKLLSSTLPSGQFMTPGLLLDLVRPPTIS